MRIIETEVFKFEELSEDGQQKAIERYWDINVDYDWWDMTYDDAGNVGIKIEGFDLDRADYCKVKIHNKLGTARSIVKNHGESCETYKTAKSFLDDYEPLKIYHDRLEDIEYNARGRFGTGDKLIQVQEILADLTDDFVRDIADDYLEILRNEYDYLTSEAAIKEMLISNEYEFTNDGKIF